jgi:hypothetical protein
MEANPGEQGHQPHFSDEGTLHLFIPHLLMVHNFFFNVSR